METGSYAIPRIEYEAKLCIPTTDGPIYTNGDKDWLNEMQKKWYEVNLCIPKRMKSKQMGQG